MIDDDALIQATLQHWHWGDDGSGDIRRPANVEAICRSAKAMAADLGTGGALLVTADGSVDCQENPNEQVCCKTVHVCANLNCWHETMLYSTAWVRRASYVYTYIALRLVAA